MLSISDEHKEAIIRLINSIISDSPLITNLTNRSKVNQKLVKLIHFIQLSVDSVGSVGSGNKLLFYRNINNGSSDALIENFILHYYFGDEVMDSFAIEDGIEQQLSTASLLILYVIYKLKNTFPHIIMYFNQIWIHLQEFNSKLDQMLRKDMINEYFGNNYNRNKSFNTEENTHCIENGFNCEIRTTNSRINNLSELSFCNSKSTTNQNNDIYSLNSNDELIIPQLLSSEMSKSVSFHSNLLTEKYICNECNRCFATKYKLTRHEFVHKPNSKPMKCTWIGCERRFRGRFDLKRHFLTHTKEKPFACVWPQCNRRFSRSDKLKIHRKKHLMDSSLKPFTL